MRKEHVLLIVRSSVLACLASTALAASAPPESPPSRVASAGAAEGREITAADYDRWRHIEDATLSPSAKFAAFDLISTSGDTELVVRSTNSTSEFRVPRGRLRGADADGVRSTAFRVPLGLKGLSIAGDGKHEHVVFAIAPPSTDEHLSTADKTPAGADADAGADPGSSTGPSVGISLGIMSLPDGHVTTIPRVSEFTVHKAAGGFVSYFADDAQPNSAGGRTLTLRNLAAGTDIQIADVRTYVLDGEGRYLAFSTASEKEGGNGVFVRRLSDGRVFTLTTDRGMYSSLAFDRAGNQVAFLGAPASSNVGGPGSSTAPVVHYAASPMSHAEVVARSSDFGQDKQIALDAGVNFTARGNALTFNVRPVVAEPATAAEDANKPHAVFDFWRWDDGILPPQQKRLAGRPAQSYLAVYHIGTHHAVQLGSPAVADTILTSDAGHAIGLEYSPYMIQDGWGDGAYDMYLIDTQSGKAELFRKKVRVQQPGSFALSPSGRFLLFYERHRWFSHEFATGKRTDLTGSLRPDTHFESAESLTMRAEPSPLGIAGWLEHDRRVLLNAERDVWEVDPTGKSEPRNLTGVAGRGKDVVFRVWRPDGADSGRASASTSVTSAFVSVSASRDMMLELGNPIALNDLMPAGSSASASSGTTAAGGNTTASGDATSAFGSVSASSGMTSALASTTSLLSGNTSSSDAVLDGDAPLLLTSFDRETMAEGLWRVKPGGRRAPEPLLTPAKKVTLLAQRNERQFLVSQESFEQFPDLWVGSRLDRLRQITDVNPQQREFSWGTAEIVEWTSNLGTDLRGVLYRPKKLDPARKYPLLVAMSETPELYRYVTPAVATDADLGQMASTYVSRGYLVFVSGVQTVTPIPGESAYASVVPGVEAVIDRGFVDTSRMAIAGSSSGGYWTNYIITRTPVFRCAIESGGWSNAISAYASYDTQVGAAYLERGAGKLGVSMWENLHIYLANSPLIFADRVKTPLLMMHNSDDHVVPFAQGQEMFVGLRRNSKESYLFNYTGEQHYLARPANRRDWDRRMEQFLAHFLKDAPEPRWMTRGFPYEEDSLEKGWLPDTEAEPAPPPPENEAPPPSFSGSSGPASQ